MMMAGLVDGNLGFGERSTWWGGGGRDDSIVLLSSSHN